MEEVPHAGAQGTRDGRWGVLESYGEDHAKHGSGPPGETESPAVASTENRYHG